MIYSISRYNFVLLPQKYVVNCERFSGGKGNTQLLLDLDLVIHNYYLTLTSSAKKNILQKDKAKW